MAGLDATCDHPPVERLPSDAEVEAFLARFTAALESRDAADAATGTIAGGRGFAFDPDRVREAAWRMALPPGSAVQLAPIARYQVEPRLEQLAAAVVDPGFRLRQLRQHVVQSAAAVARAKSAAWTTTDPRRDLYPVLNAALTELGLGAGLAEALAASEQRGGPPATGPMDAIVECPSAGAGVSTRWSCARCIWVGPGPTGCFLPAAKAYAVAADARGKAGALLPPPALRALP